MIPTDIRRIILGYLPQGQLHSMSGVTDVKGLLASPQQALETAETWEYVDCVSSMYPRFQYNYWSVAICAAIDNNVIKLQWALTRENDGPITPSQLVKIGSACQYAAFELLTRSATIDDRGWSFILLGAIIARRYRVIDYAMQYASLRPEYALHICDILTQRPDLRIIDILMPCSNIIIRLFEQYWLTRPDICRFMSANRHFNREHLLISGMRRGNIGIFQYAQKLGARDYSGAVKGVLMIGDHKSATLVRCAAMCAVIDWRDIIMNYLPIIRDDMLELLFELARDVDWDFVVEFATAHGRLDILNIAVRHFDNNWGPGSAPRPVIDWARARQHGGQDVL